VCLKPFWGNKHKLHFLLVAAAKMNFQNLVLQTDAKLRVAVFITGEK